jgi:hypothetical protein
MGALLCHVTEDLGGPKGLSVEGSRGYEVGIHFDRGRYKNRDNAMDTTRILGTCTLGHSFLFSIWPAEVLVCALLCVWCQAVWMRTPRTRL